MTQTGVSRSREAAPTLCLPADAAQETKEKKASSGKMGCRTGRLSTVVRAASLAPASRELSEKAAAVVALQGFVYERHPRNALHAEDDCDVYIYIYIYI